MTPSDAVRPPRFAACAWPFTRRISIAFSTSPSASTSAFLQSIIPAPVRSRSSFTSLAEMVASAMSARSFHVVGIRHGRRLFLGLRLSLLAAARPLGRLVGGRLLVALGALDLLARRLLARGLGLLTHLRATGDVGLARSGRRLRVGARLGRARVRIACEGRAPRLSASGL